MPIDPHEVGKQVASLAHGRKWIVAPCSRCHKDFGFFEGTVADHAGDKRICTGCSMFAGTPFDGAISGL